MSKRGIRTAPAPGKWKCLYSNIYYLHEYYRYFQYITLKLMQVGTTKLLLMEESVELKMKTKW